MTTRSGSRTTMRAASVRPVRSPGRLIRAIGSALSSRTTVAVGVRSTTGMLARHLLRSGDVIAHAELAQQPRRRDARPRVKWRSGGGLPFEALMASWYGEQLHRVVAGDVLEPVARARHVEQEVAVLGRARTKRSCLRRVKSFDQPVAKRVGPSAARRGQQEARGRGRRRERLRGGIPVGRRLMRVLLRVVVAREIDREHRRHERAGEHGRERAPRAQEHQHGSASRSPGRATHLCASTSGSITRAMTTASAATSHGDGREPGRPKRDSGQCREREREAAAARARPDAR